jgi:hypothetical protein
MIGFVIGLGDRHLDNILLDLSTGQVSVSQDSTGRASNHQFRPSFLNYIHFIFKTIEEPYNTNY